MIVAAAGVVEWSRTEVIRALLCVRRRPVDMSLPPRHGDLDTRGCKGIDGQRAARLSIVPLLGPNLVTARRPTCRARLLVSDPQHDLAGAVLAQAALERRAAIGEGEDLVDRHPQAAAVHEPREFNQLLTVRLDNEVDG